jgi:hypothetical protein
LRLPLHEPLLLRPTCQIQQPTRLNSQRNRSS